MRRLHCCEDICPTHALALDDEVEIADVMDGVARHIALPVPKHNVTGTGQILDRIQGMFGGIVLER